MIAMKLNVMRRKKMSTSCYLKILMNMNAYCKILKLVILYSCFLCLLVVWANSHEVNMHLFFKKSYWLVTGVLNQVHHKDEFRYFYWKCYTQDHWLRCCIIIRWPLGHFGFLLNMSYPFYESWSFSLNFNYFFNSAKIILRIFFVLCYS